MEILELRNPETRRNVEWPTTLEEFLAGAKRCGHQVAKLHGVERWLIFNPVTMAWCEVGRPTLTSGDEGAPADLTAFP